MIEKIKKEELAEFMKNNMAVVIGNGRTFTHFPFWLEVAEDGKLTVHKFEDLPQNLREAIEEMRNKTFDYSSTQNMVDNFFPMNPHDIKNDFKDGKL